tara:strand:+ start:33204 stop:33506 length:303 start_codon:yes stop_codon:yes gene_type:complete
MRVTPLIDIVINLQRQSGLSVPALPWVRLSGASANLPLKFWWCSLSFLIWLVTRFFNSTAVSHRERESRPNPCVVITGRVRILIQRIGLDEHSINATLPV